MPIGGGYFCRSVNCRNFKLADIVSIGGSDNGRKMITLIRNCVLYSKVHLHHDLMNDYIKENGSSLKIKTREFEPSN